MTWKDAIVFTFQRNKHFDKFRPMHYRDITDYVIWNNLVDTKGQTPANTVSNTLTTNNDIFEPLGEGEYKLTEKGEKYNINSTKQKASKEEPTNLPIKESQDQLSENDKQILIPAYGMYWMREGINWDKHPKLLGVQSTGVPPIDLSDMRGVYMLYDGREVIYVGQAVDRPILKRLIEHTKNRLANRWNRFSWFGIDSIDSSAEVIKTENSIKTDIYSLVNAFEGILIEGLEPRQNRKQGDNFGFEYYQEIDLEVRKNRLVSELSKLNLT